MCRFDNDDFGTTSWADEWCLVLEVAADDEVGNSSVFLNDGIEHVFGFGYLVAALADSTMSISMQDVYTYFPLARSDVFGCCEYTSQPWSTISVYSTSKTQYKSCQLLS